MKFGTDGVRGEALTELTVDYVAALGRAAAQVLGGGRWLIGRDTRESGPALEAAVAAGLAAGGAEPVTMGVLPTPALAWLAAELGVPAAMVTASHNPWHDNGVKIFGAGGLKLTDDVERRIESAIVLDGAVQAHMLDIDEGAVARYVDHIVAAAGSLHDVHVVLDCANGAMSSVAPVAFERCGARVTVLHAAPDGRNINLACGATDVASLSAAVVETGAHLGLAFDGDGDRVARMHLDLGE